MMEAPTLESPRLVAPRPRAIAFSGVSDRDRRILALAARHIQRDGRDFDEAARALRAAVEEVIPSGRIFLLGETSSGPIVGSLISGVGVTPSEMGVLVVRVTREGQKLTLGKLAAR